MHRLFLPFWILGSALAQEAIVVNQTCVQEQLELLHRKASEQLDEIIGVPSKLRAKVLSHSDNATSILVTVNAKVSKKVNVITDIDGTILEREELSHIDLKNAKVTAFGPQEQLAAILELNGDFFLTFMHNSSSNSTILLSNRGVHGRVLTDDTFGTLQFSPNGKYLMYVAEEAVHPLQKFLYRGSYGFRKGIRPVVLIYDIDNGDIKKMDGIPREYSAGNLIWKPDSSGIFGVVWKNTPFSAGCPDGANKVSQLFSIGFKDAFQLLTSNLSHVASPRVKDGVLYYFENPVQDVIANPGSRLRSRRLMKIDFTRFYFEKEVEEFKILVDQVFKPSMELESGNIFQGLYPLLPLPERCFSNGKMHFTTYQNESLRLVSVDVDSGEIKLHPDSNIRLLDVTEDVMLVEKSHVDVSPILMLGMVDQPAPTSTTETSTITVETTTETTTETTSETTTESDDNNSTDCTTTESPCEELLQELEISDVEYDHYIHKRSTESSNSIQFNEITLNLTAPIRKQYRVDIIEMDDIQGETNNTTDEATTQAILISPKYMLNLPLVVFIHGGPQSTTKFDIPINFFLSMDLGVLLVNYRGGSTGRGDESLATGGLAEEDVDKAVEKVFNTYTQFDTTRIGLFGDSYGSFIALNLAASKPEKYVVVVENPVVDLSALAVNSNCPELAWYLIGVDLDDDISRHSEIWLER